MYGYITSQKPYANAQRKLVLRFFRWGKDELARNIPWQSPFNACVCMNIYDRRLKERVDEVFISTALVDFSILGSSIFMIGHELGHWIMYNHGDYVWPKTEEELHRDEYLADKLGVLLMMQYGFSPHGAFQFFMGYDRKISKFAAKFFDTHEWNIDCPTIFGTYGTDDSIEDQCWMDNNPKAWNTAVTRYAELYNPELKADLSTEDESVSTHPSDRDRIRSLKKFLQVGTFMDHRGLDGYSFIKG